MQNMLHSSSKPLCPYQKSWFLKIRMKGYVFAPFSGGGSVEDISSIILSYYVQEFHFLSLRIDFLNAKMTPKMTKFWPWK